MTDENSTKIKVFGNDDESLKILGQLLSSETSRKIIHLLTQEELYTNQISKKLGIQMNTAVFHLKKLVEVGLVTVTHKQIVKKGVDHKYYKMMPNIFVTSTQSKKEVHENGFLKKFFKEGIKFASIITASTIVYVTSQKIYESQQVMEPIGYLPPSIPMTEFWPIIFGMSTIIISLIIERIIYYKKRKK